MSYPSFAIHLHRHLSDLSRDVNGLRATPNFPFWEAQNFPEALPSDPAVPEERSASCVWTVLQNAIFHPLVPCFSTRPTRIYYEANITKSPYTTAIVQVESTIQHFTKTVHIYPSMCPCIGIITGSICLMETRN